MTNPQTFELSIFPGSRRSELVAFLESQGIEDYVEAATDTINADDLDWESVLTDWTERDDSPLLIYRKSEDELTELMVALPLRFGVEVTFSGKWIADSLWQEAWEPDFRFLETERFFIGPKELAPDSAKIILTLAEAAVFGSGQHASTQALVRLMEAQARPEPESTFLDVGTGTGVLAFVAHHLGFGSLLGTDIEECAIAIAAKNAAANHIPLKLHLGSLPPGGESWATIACNILPPTLTDLLETLTTLLKPEGQLYLAGFHEANRETVEREIHRLGFRIIEERRERGWLGWLAQRMRKAL